MIRDATLDDRDAVLALAVSAGLFPPEEVGVVDELLGAFFADAPEAHGYLVDVDEEARVVGVSYHQPKAVDGVVDLTMIAVDPAVQGRGRGRALLVRVEELVAAANGRLLLVETSGAPEFDQARAFYRTCGYAQVGQIPDYWEPGDDLVLFSKPLA